MINSYQLRAAERNGFSIYRLDGKLQATRKALNFINNYDYMPEAKADYLQKVDAMHSEAMLSQIGRYTAEERETWNIKLLAAQAYLSGTANDIQKQLIELEAPAYNYTAEQHAQRVVEKSAGYSMLIAMLATYREQARSAIAQATTLNELDDVLAQMQQSLNEGVT